jgi:Uma2 family endonuclease
MSPTGLEHLDITDTLHAALRAYVVANRLGKVTLPDVGFWMSQPGQSDVVLSSNVAFVSVQKMQQLPARGSRERKKFLPVAPDLAAEVVSPDQYRPEMADKAQLYLTLGVRLDWIVWSDPRQVDVWRPGSDTPAATLGIGDALDGLDVLPGFTLPLAD